MQWNACPCDHHILFLKPFWLCGYHWDLCSNYSECKYQTFPMQIPSFSYKEGREVATLEWGWTSNWESQTYQIKIIGFLSPNIHPTEGTGETRSTENDEERDEQLRSKLRPSLHASGCSVAQSCPVLCSPMVCGPPAFSILWIFQIKILEWVTVSFSRGSSWHGIEPRSPSLQADSLPLNHLARPDFHRRRMLKGTFGRSLWLFELDQICVLDAHVLLCLVCN